jgi:hypothetical protein
MSITIPTHAVERHSLPPLNATETRLPGGRIEITSHRSSRRKIIIEPGSSSSPLGALLRLHGVAFSMNDMLKRHYGGRWDPIGLCWTIPASKGIALRAYLCEYF